ncbi:hypothetical protein [Olleya sp. R77988]|uniref:hypothetical protein n=1 Tax=Olleya sp. R77988 TaxID=3093875 RepID=UPI0037C5CD46
MNIIDTPLYKEVKEIHKFPLGDVFLFENVVIAQINEGKHVSIESGQECFKAIHDFYGAGKQFGYISNRIHRYSIEALDYPKHNIIFPNLKIYAIIGYSHFNELNIDIEKQFCKVPFFGFQTITEAYKYVNNYILNKSTKIA